MAENKELVVTGIPSAKVKAIAERVALEFQLAADKVAAHHAEPGKYPLPSDAKSTEQLLARRFRTLPEAQQKQAADRISVELRGGAARTKRLGDLAKIDLKSPSGIDEQVRKTPLPARMKFPVDELQRMSDALVGPMTTATQETAAAAAFPELRNLELRIHRVKCVDETSEIGKDEIDAGGTSVDEDGDTKKISAFRVRSFSTGTVQAYSPPRRFTTFSLTEQSKVTFPKTYFVTLVVAEVDWGGLADFLNELLDKVKAKVAAALAAAIGGAIGSPGGPLGIAIGVAVGFVVGLVFDYLKGLWGDEVFKPITVSATISSLISRFPGGQDNSTDRTLDFKGHGGHYQLTYDWRKYN
ncbi:hypothetical protein [Streptomyces yerevanensis]|uniref:hypothetical protein n=1 Tax=Streptomyces yerevanensis TaxID=66378 RepID=UPI0005276542|nr:hypothetical protein [Streptomyces yerevanensis]